MTSPAPARRLRRAGPCVAVALLAAIAPVPAGAWRLAIWEAPLGREGPGLLLRDLLRDNPALAPVDSVIAAAAADTLLLTDVDWDADGAALDRLASRWGYAHALALPPNAGMPSGLDLDADGRLGTARDAWGYGRFSGAGGMAILSRAPLTVVADLTELPWAELPGARMPVRADGTLFPLPEVAAVRPLSSTGHWIVEAGTDGEPVTLLAWDATAPVFDGAEDANGLRNADELALWRAVLDGRMGGVSAPQDRFALIGLANLDPEDGAGLRADMTALLADPRLQDPRPASPGGAAAADTGQQGDPSLDTADWPGACGTGEDTDAADPTGEVEPCVPGPGNLRVSYVLPSADLAVTGSGVLWPREGPLSDAVAVTGPHRLVWVDLATGP